MALVEDGLPQIVCALGLVADEEADDVVDRRSRGCQPLEQAEQLHVDLKRVVHLALKCRV